MLFPLALLTVSRETHPEVEISVSANVFGTFAVHMFLQVLQTNSALAGFFLDVGRSDPGPLKAITRTSLLPHGQIHQSLSTGPVPYRTVASDTPRSGRLSIT